MPDEGGRIADATLGKTPLTLSRDAVAQRLTMAPLVAALGAVLAEPVVVPDRHHHPFAVDGVPDAGMLLLMPAWRPDGLMGVKIASVVPGNRALGLPSIVGSYLLLDAGTGVPLMLADASVLTARRTAAVAALAASRLARPDSARLLLVGAGALAEPLVEAYRTQFALREVGIWARRREAAAEVAGRTGADVVESGGLEAAVGRVDILCCATGAGTPLVLGGWLGPGTHVDLLGGYTPAMREVDAEALARSDVFVDTRKALSEAGDLAVPIAAGSWSPDRLVGDLPQLLRGEVPGRRDANAITLFKSIGTGAADLAAATLLWTSRTPHPD